MSNRRVHFSVPLYQIEYLDKEWDPASQLARDGSDWLRMGLDRQRFTDRIERTAETLNRILDPAFRQRIYRERFENFVLTTDPDLDQDNLALEFSRKTKITTGDINESDTEHTDKVNTAPPKLHNVTQGQGKLKDNNSPYISWKRGRRKRHLKRRHNNKKRDKRKH